MSLGGPIKKDRLWFFSSYRDWGVYQYIANSFFGWGPKGPNFPGTTPAGEQAVDDASLRSGVVRLTTQLGKHKIAGYLDRIRRFRGHENSAGAGVVIAGEATDIRSPKQYYTAEAKWTTWHPAISCPSVRSPRSRTSRTGRTYPRDSARRGTSWATARHLNPAKLGLVDNLDQNSSNNSRVFTGYDLTFQTR